MGRAKRAARPGQKGLGRARAQEISQSESQRLSEELDPKPDSLKLDRDLAMKDLRYGNTAHCVVCLLIACHVKNKSKKIRVEFEK